MKSLFILVLWVLPCLAQEKKVVSVTLAPYAYAIEQIVQDSCTVNLLIPENANPHLYDSKPSEFKLLKESTLWFCSGETIENKISDSFSVKKIDLNQSLELINGGCCHHKVLDLHTWMSPKNYLIQARLILATLCQSFPDLKENFTQNFIPLEQELVALSEKVDKLKADARPIIVSHGSYAYLCRDLGVIQTSIEHEGKEATLKHIQTIFNQSKLTPPKVIFAQVQHSDAGAKRLSELLNVPVIAVNPYQKNYPQAIEEMTCHLTIKR